MSYFNNLPYIEYELNGSYAAVKNILARSMFISEHKPYSHLYLKHNILNGESIQYLAKRYYDSASYHWVIALMNEIHDLQNEWPLDQLSLERFVDAKYGSDKTKTRHWINSSGIVCGECREYIPGHPDDLPNPGVDGNQEYTRITFEEYESKLNDDKRLINILKPQLLGDFLQQFKDSFN